MNGIRRLTTGDLPPQPPSAAAATQRTAAAASLFGVPQTPGGLVQISIELRWRLAGEIRAGRDGRLSFPEVVEGPALYRFRFLDETGPKAAMIGEAADLARRFAQFANPTGAGESVQMFHDLLRIRLGQGQRIELDIVTSDRTLRIAGRAHPVDLADLGVRRLLEQAARIAEGASAIDDQD
ncbi:hypothetical protein [Flavisphingomonas formosensis]|uniref:hypothetical protein n=1 Tax=Flavisphingomonas formosensis TaxID=861534 RepID=UPI0012F75772|nr:hypothetical protein [Sphingomonas formosensis]